MVSEAADIPVVRRIADLRRRVAEWKATGNRVGLVPTMGALHKAHDALIDEAQARADRVVITIFVNPKQFGPAEDFGRYPRREEEDLAMLREAGVDLVFAPPPDEMYPEGFATTVSVGGGLTDGLCATARPGHFEGVATVCAKLFNQSGADIAMFGEKDYQQLLIVRRMVRDLDIPIAIASVATVREPDGLALSSRNVYLDDAQRARAGRINKVLAETAERLSRPGASLAAETARGREALVAAGLTDIDYFEVRDAETLAPVTDLVRPARVFTAVRLGGTRLIDNWPIPTRPEAG